ncbi:hypothetical protein GBA52_022771 [Prunus armeniaca]|nr:hypothetical protein GBA52_022771 [Prunus armeniaca]
MAEKIFRVQSHFTRSAQEHLRLNSRCSETRFSEWLRILGLPELRIRVHFF